MKIFKLIGLTLIVVTLLTSISCNTAKGFGKDVKKTGEAIEKQAEKAK